MKITCALFLLGCLCHQTLSEDGIRYAIVDAKANWYGALAGCRSHGMELLTIYSQEENEKVRRGGLSFDSSGYWTSGNNMAVTNVYFWIGAGYQLGYVNWDPKEPGDTTDVPGCIAYLKGATFTKTNCFGLKKYICEQRNADCNVPTNPDLKFFE